MKAFNHRSLGSILMVLAVGYGFVAGFQRVHGDDQWDALQGKRPPITVVTPASGPFAEQHPFQKESFGKTRGFCPANGAKGNAVMVYLRTLSPKNIAWLQRIEAAMESQPKWNETFVHVFDAKGAQVGGYSADELETRIAELRTIANQEKWERISVGVTANSAGDRVGLEDGCTLVVVLLTPTADSKGRSVVRWHAYGREESLDEDTFKEWLQAIESHMQ